MQTSGAAGLQESPEGLRSETFGNYRQSRPRFLRGGFVGVACHYLSHLLARGKPIPLRNQNPLLPNLQDDHFITRQLLFRHAGPEGRSRLTQGIQ